MTSKVQLLLAYIVWCNAWDTVHDVSTAFCFGLSVSSEHVAQVVLYTACCASLFYMSDHVMFNAAEL